MSRVEPQLREYFDAGVERISVDDVIAHARVRENQLEPLRLRRNLKPAWAAVAAFAVTILGLGGLAATLKLTERITGEFGSDAAEIVAADGGALGIWLIAAFVAALAAAAVTWLIRGPATKDSQDRHDQGKVMVMETIEDTDRYSGATKETTKPSRWPTIVMAVLAVAVVALVAWMIFAMRPNSPNAAPPEIVQLMEDYNTAWNAHDVDAIEGLVTSNYRIRSSVFDYDIEGVRETLMPQLVQWDWHATNDGPYYAVTTANVSNTWDVSSEGGVINRSGRDHGTSGLWRVVQIGSGEFLIAEHTFMGG
jgi:hypothetical protein